MSVELEAIRAAVALLTDVDLDLVVPEARLDALDVDSMTFAEMIFSIEDRLHKVIDIDRPGPQTVGELMAIIAAAPASKDAP